jgi:hypothetical protein
MLTDQKLGATLPWIANVVGGLVRDLPRILWVLESSREAMAGLASTRILGVLPNYE